MSLEFIDVQCPYCWERIDIEVESGMGTQDFIQDCTVCCRPIRLVAVDGEEGLEVTPSRSD
jgi:hypothetical protein